MNKSGLQNWLFTVIYNAPIEGITKTTICTTNLKYRIWLVWALLLRLEIDHIYLYGHRTQTYFLVLISELSVDLHHHICYDNEESIQMCYNTFRSYKCSNFNLVSSKQPVSSKQSQFQFEISHSKIQNTTGILKCADDFVVRHWKNINNNHYREQIQNSAF